MSNVPKIVQERLRAAAREKAWPEGVARAHPDPDLLTAFAEQALPPAERQGVLEHLARCGDCREVVALALPAAEPTPKIAAKEDAARAVTVRPPRHWFAAPALRWAALAAGIVVAGAIVLTQSGKPKQTLEAKRQVETARPQPAAATPAKPAAAPARTNSELASSAQNKPPQKALDSDLNRRSRDQESRIVADLKTAPAVVAGRVLPPSPAKKEKEDLFAKAAPASPGTPSPPIPSAKESVEVTSAAAAVDTAAANTQDAFVARNEPAPSISKAKAAMPAMDEAAAPPGSGGGIGSGSGGGIGSSVTNRLARVEAANLQQSATVAAQWQVVSGALQRSLDRGATWQTSMRSERPLLCFAARGNEIWAGGKAGALFHSADGGVNWTQVSPSADGQSLSADVTHIETRSSAEIILATSSGESWTTLDGGKSWVKK